MPRQPVQTGTEPLHVSLLAIPEAVVSTLSGIFDVMNAFAILPALREQPAPFKVEIVGLQTGPLKLASNVPVTVQRSVDTIDRTDIVIVPSILLGPDGWEKDRHPELVDWFRAMHRRGALLCSACSGIFLLAETGLFDGVGCDRAFRLCARLHRRLSRSAGASGARAGGFRQARGTDHVRRLHDLARPGALPDRTPRGRDRGADGRAFLRAAMASGRTCALHGFRGAHRSRRRSRGKGARLGGDAFPGRQSAGGDGAADRAHRTHLQAPLHQRDGA